MRGWAGMNPTVLAVGSLIVIFGIGIWVRHSGMRQHLGNILIPCSLIAVSLAFLVLTFGFPSQEEAGPALIPRLWIYMILVLSGIILGQILRGKDEVAPKIERPGLLVLVMAALIGYFVAMPFMGYFLSTFLFIVLLLNVLSYRKKLLLYLIAGGWCLVSYLVFYKLLYIQLPLGFFEGLF
jgi:putative tricarboxylic transport membrane protein